MYEVLAYWETAHTLPDQSPVALDYAQIWQASDKIVYSKTLAEVSTERTRLERDFDPEAVRALKVSASADVSIGGPELAAHAFKASLVDEVHLFLAPVVIGSGNAALPTDARVELELLDQRRFAGGFVHLHYRVA